MKTIRIGTFETNSSSTHTLVMMSKEEYEKFKAGDIFYKWDGKFVSKEDLEQEAMAEGKTLEESIDYHDYKSLENFGDGYEDFYEEYITPKGDIVVAIGYYGDDR